MKQEMKQEMKQKEQGMKQELENLKQKMEQRAAPEQPQLAEGQRVLCVLQKQQPPSRTMICEGTHWEAYTCSLM